MTPNERAAYDLGIRAAIQAAQIAAITIETAPDSHTFRKQVAAETLAAFAEAAEGLKLAQVEAAYSDCTARVEVSKAESNGGVHAQCESPG